MIPNREGVVVFISFSPRRGMADFAHAAAARAALENLTGSLALEWSKHGIRAVCVALGSIGTGRWTVTARNGWQSGNRRCRSDGSARRRRLRR